MRFFKSASPTNSEIVNLDRVNFFNCHWIAVASGHELERARIVFHTDKRIIEWSYKTSSERDVEFNAILSALEISPIQEN